MSKQLRIIKIIEISQLGGATEVAVWRKKKGGKKNTCRIEHEKLLFIEMGILIEIEIKDLPVKLVRTISYSCPSLT